MSSAFTAVAKAAEDVSTMTKEKVELPEVEKKEIIHGERKGPSYSRMNWHRYTMRSLQLRALR